MRKKPLSPGTSHLIFCSLAGIYALSSPGSLAFGLTELTPSVLLGFLLQQQVMGCLSSMAETTLYNKVISLQVCYTAKTLPLSLLDCFCLPQSSDDYK